MLTVTLTALALAQAPALPEIPEEHHRDHAEVGLTAATALAPFLGVYGGWDGRVRAMGAVEYWPGPRPGERLLFDFAGQPAEGFAHLRAESELGYDLTLGLRLSGIAQLSWSPGMARQLAGTELDGIGTGLLGLGPRLAAGPQLGQVWVRGALDALWPVARLHRRGDGEDRTSEVGQRPRYRAYVDVDGHLGKLVLGGELGLAHVRAPESWPDANRRPVPHLRARVGYAF